ncbi:hypothetical protein, partial [Escherichia coli]|uniref:hypothetical protein n=1 Tax=Escherichia coli TaxID=562 RepID=UPI00195FF95C
YLTRLKPTARALERVPRSTDEFIDALRNDARPEALLARWKLNAATALPRKATLFLVELQGFAYPDRSDGRAVSGAYRLTGAWAISEQALLEVVW